MSDIQQILFYKPQNINPKNSSKIYFACHPSEFSNRFDEVFKDIFETASKNNITCTMWYRNPEITLTEAETEVLLSQIAEMQLVVVPITQALLDDPTAVMESEIALAKSKNIPILPLLDDASLISIYSKPEFFGDIQFLSKKLPDATALPFDKKLSDFLKSVLVGDKMRQEIQSAFDAYIFLSYRKKDRAAAQELMRLIHKNDFCRDIAIWYDEFLTPGENFNQAIQEALQKSELFTLVVTPNITEPHNYVLEHEYPMAMDAQKPILPVESVPTDRAELERCFENLPTVADAHNPTELSEALLDRLKKIAIRENDTPYHNYLIGLAYLNGIDVETDPEKAEELLTSAAKADLPEAMVTLSDMYKTGKGVTRDYQKSLEWLENANGIYIQLNMAENGKYVEQVINTLSLLATYYLNFGQNRSAEKFANEAVMYCRNAFKDTDNEKFIRTALLNDLMLISARVNLLVNKNPDISVEETQKFSYSLYQKVAEFIEECNLSPEQLKNIGDVAGMVYNQLSVFEAIVSSNILKAQEYQNKANELMGFSHELRSLATDFFSSISDNSLDFDGYMEMLKKYLDMCEDELNGIIGLQRQSYLSQILTGTTVLPQVISDIAQAFDPEDNPEELSKIKDFLYRYADIFKDMDIDTLGNDLLTDLALVYSNISEFEQSYGDIEKARDFNLKTQLLAKKSFEYYPTQRAYKCWMATVNDCMALYPDYTPDKETWLQFEEQWEKLFRDPREPLNGLEYLSVVYNNLLITAERNEDREEIRKYSSKAYDLAKRKFRHTNSIDDEIEVLDAHFFLLSADLRCERIYIDSDIKRLMNRCGELLNNYKEYNLNGSQYNKIAVIYCKAVFLLARTYIEQEKWEDVCKYLEIFIGIAKQINDNGKFDDDIANANTMLTMLSEIDNLPDDEEE